MAESESVQLWERRRGVTQAEFDRMLAAGEIRPGMVFSIQPEISIIELSPVGTTPEGRAVRESAVPSES